MRVFPCFNLLLVIMSVFPSALALAIENENPAPSDFWYFQGEVGGTFLSEACADGYTICEDNSYNFSGVVGYQITPNFSLQGGYRHLGQFERRQNDTSRELALSAFEASVVGSLPISHTWSLYGLAGVSVGQSVYSNGTALNNLFSNGVSLSPIIGGGARYRINEQWQAYAGMQWSTDVSGSTSDAGIYTLGVRYELPSGKSVPAPIAVPQVATPSPVVETVVINKKITSLDGLTRNVYFGFNEVTLTSLAQKDIQSVVARLTAYPSSHVRLLGFADGTGSVEVNRVVSQRRVDAVKTYLIDLGVDAEQIETESFGRVDPTYNNETAEGRAMNRRVSLIMDPLQVEE